MSQLSYIEQCIQALPVAKQAAAREAFRDLLEGREDDGTLTRLLIVFEATAAYGRTIPHEMVTGMDRNLKALDERIGQLAGTVTEADDRRLAQFKTVLQAQLPAMVKTLSSEKLACVVENLRVSVDRLERSSRRQRRLRLAIVAAFMLAAAVAATGGTVAWFQKDYAAGQAARQRFAVLRDYGVTLRLTDGGNQALRVTVNGTIPLHERTWLVNGAQQNVGVEFIVPAP